MESYLVLKVKEAYGFEGIHYYFSSALPSIPSEDYNYIGAESLPFAGEGELIIESKRVRLWDNERWEHNVTKNTIPQSVLEQLKEYRKSRLTLDLDYTDSFELSYLDKLHNISSDPIFIKTQRGYHVVIQLKQPLGFQDRLKLRQDLGDDLNRIHYDRILHDLGFEGLTDILFDYKWWEGENSFHKWQEVNNIPVQGKISFTLPSMQLKLNNKEIRIEKDTVVLSGFSSKDAKWIIRSIEDNFWEYSHMIKRRETFPDKFYSAVRKHCGSVLAAKLNVYEQQGLVKFVQDFYGPVVITLKGEAQQIAGLLIGKQGSKIKAIQEELGMKIKIVNEREPQQITPVEDVIRKRLEDTLAQFSDVRIQKIRKYV